VQNDIQKGNENTQMEKFEIMVKGQLDLHWSGWFDGLSITHTESGETVLSGPIRDQAALRGLIINLSDLGLPLISVNILPWVEGQLENSSEKEAIKR